MRESTGPDVFRRDGLSGDSNLRFGFRGRILAILFLVLAGWLASTTLEPPRNVPGKAGDFSLERAMADVQALAGEPRPTGSKGHALARQYILDEIRAAGLAPEMQEAVVPAGEPPHIHRLTRVQNVFARLAGTGEGDAVMLAAHYDSVPTAPGAGDDASGVATLLETMRVLADGDALSRDVVFLFTDAEELGLHGARAFVDAGLAEGIGWVLNFEARGAGGPSVMFETLPGNLEAMRFFARVSPRPVASSYSYDVYRRMPNDTDFSVFRERIPAGFNFAFIEDPTAYHSAADTPQRLEEASLRHHGDQALSLARALAESPPGTGGSRAVYFSLPLLGLVVYPAGVDRLFAAGSALLGLVVLTVGLKRRRLTPGRCLLGLIIVAVGIGVSVGGLMGLRWLWMEGLDLARDTKGVLEALGYALLLIALGLAAVVVRLALPRLGALNLAAAAALTWTALAVAAAWLLESSAFLFTWPVLFAWAGLLIGVGRGRGRSRWRAAAVLACALPAVLIWLPTLEGLTVALGLASVILGIGAALPVVLVGLQLAQITGIEWGSWHVPAAALVGGFVLLGWAVVTAGPAPDHPRGDSLVYTLDSASGEAWWASYDDAPDDWTADVLGGNPGRRTLPAFFTEDLVLLTAPAQVLPLPPPTVAIVTEELRDDGGRTLTLELFSRRAAPFLEVHVSPRGDLRAAAVDGRSLKVNDAFRVTYHAFPQEGIELVLELAGDEPVELSVVDGTFGLPETIGPGKRPARFEPRRYPPTVHARKFPFSDTTLVRTVWRTAQAPEG